MKIGAALIRRHRRSSSCRQTISISNSQHHHQVVTVGDMAGAEVYTGTACEAGNRCELIGQESEIRVGILH